MPHEIIKSSIQGETTWPWLYLNEDYSFAENYEVLCNGNNVGEYRNESDRRVGGRPNPLRFIRSSECCIYPC